MTEITTIATVAAIAAVGILSPGPDLIAVSYTAMTRDRRQALAVAAGVVLGNGVWAGAALLGVGILFALFPSLFLTIKLAGALYLMWLGVKLLRHAKHPLPEKLQGTAKGAMVRGCSKGFLTTLSNPKAAIYYASALSMAAPSGAGWGLLLSMLMAVVGVASLWFLVVVFLLSNPCASRVFRCIKVYFESLFGVLLLAFGLRQLLSRS